jgi:hypothetical protein
LCHHARVGTDAVDVAVVHGGLTYPHHALLHGQGDEVLDGRQFVAAGAGRNGETTSDLVFPCAAPPLLGGGISEFFELP